MPDTHLFCPACDDFTADGAAVCQRCGGQAFLANAGDPQRLQEVLGPAYEVRRILGEGTFGVVHEVYDRPLNRMLAVKVLKTPTRELLDRFGLEAQILANLRHPSIVPLHFIGSQGGIAFMAMPKLAGIPLRNGRGRGCTQSVLIQQVQQPPPHLRTLRADVPPRYEAAVLRALAKQPEDRFPTAGAFAAELRDALKPTKRSWWRR